MACAPKAALIPDGDLTWLGGLGLEAAAGLNRRQKEALVDMRHGRTWSNGEYREHFGVTAEEARSDLRDLVSRGLVTSTGEFLVLMDVSSTVAPRRRSSVSRETMTLGPRPAIVGWGFSIWSGGVAVRQLYCRHQ